MTVHFAAKYGATQVLGLLEGSIKPHMWRMSKAGKNALAPHHLAAAYNQPETLIWLLQTCSGYIKMPDKVCSWLVCHIRLTHSLTL
jgi:hypothetical protein